MRSALYDGVVHHARREPDHAFRHRVRMAYVDLDELPRPLGALVTTRVPGLAWLRRRDLLGPADVPPKEAVLDRVAAALGRRPDGRVGVLTHLRVLGYVFNPVSFYYVHAADGRLEAVVAEITNTPWKERHAYVLDARAAERDPGGGYVWRFPKAFHVSPFFDMDHVYEWRFTPPGDELGVAMTSLHEGRSVFVAGLACRRREGRGLALALALPGLVLLTLRVHAAIYWQAFRLWRKRAPFFVHPGKRAALQETPAP